VPSRSPLAAVLVGAIVTAACTGTVGASAPDDPAGATVSIDAARVSGSLRTRLGTQFVWPGALEIGAARQRFNSLAPPLVRINATTVGYPDLPLVLPAGVVQGDWNFENLDSIVDDIHRGGGQVVLTIAYAPFWMWNCSTGTIRDPTFSEFATYAARLVAYYNRGSFVAENGRTIGNPAGSANRIDYWELWNEPDQQGEACFRSHPNLSVPQYVTMWNAASAKMLAIDPTIKLVGPTTANAITRHVPDYLPALMAGASRRPDIVSFHAYGGWKNSQSDDVLFSGERGCCGIDTIDRGIDQVQAWAPGIPIWITELNVSSAWDQDDPAARPWTALGAAWGAAAFRRIALGDVDAIFQFKFVAPQLRQFSLVDPADGGALLPYWRDYYLARYFPPGSAILASSGSQRDIEVLAVRAPGSDNVRVLVVDRKVNGPDVVGGPGKPTTVRVTVGHLDGVTAVFERTLDARTPLPDGPVARALPTASQATVTLSGYGASMIEFVRSSPPVSGPPRVTGVPWAATADR
jgi:hypothetical protein